MSRSCTDNGQRTTDDGRRNMKIGLEFWKQNSQLPKQHLFISRGRSLRTEERIIDNFTKTLLAIGRREDVIDASLRRIKVDIGDFILRYDHDVCNSADAETVINSS